VAEPCTVLIGASDLLPGLQERAGAINGELLIFTDADALAAVQAIVKRHPQVIALERNFAVTPRGVALINRIKVDPSLRQSEIRVLEHNSDYMRVVPRAPAAPAPVLDQRGTRRAQRSKMAARVEVLLDGKTATLVDLSIVGAQVVSASMLKPNQQIGVTLKDEVADVRFNASVAWTSFEIPPNSGPRYRAGINFNDAEAAAVDAYCTRHKA
jgi:hypothetical protein